MMDDSFKNYWMNKLKYFSLFILLFAIYWFPDVILGYPEIYLKSLVGYDRQAMATWIFLGNMAISLFLGILICYKLGYYKNTLSIFKIKNILFLLFTTIVLFIIYFFTFTYYNSHFITPGIAKEQADYSRQIVFPFVQFISFAICAPIFEEAAFRTTIYRFFKNDKIAFIVSSISFAWMHTGANPILIVYLPMSVVLTLIYHRRRVLGESILVHGLMNALLPTIIVLLQTITGLYYL
ncbi:CPBP family intramembrane metalloprotease [Lactococcus lactis]|uniref:CPBP family intramembrane glutamic endopeptidase n=2 Tax=Lactococcus lactis TaxID=1358 RepID=UPI001911D5C1|nr:CPBP family intramembrane glutamic endopeptidase [Lactococcus lactis]MCM6845665.1 CPBP family intramembrane metalloprotease [Lactococcus lactis]MCT0447592.1 CPBP family intramembrane metalloprotease [Lactococcus lactis subsp. lactis]